MDSNNNSPYAIDPYMVVGAISCPQGTHQRLSGLLFTQGRSPCVDVSSQCQGDPPYKSELRDEHDGSPLRCVR